MTTPANHTASAERVKLVAAFRAASKHWDSTEQHSANALVERGQELSRAAHALIEHLERSETHKAPYCYSDCMAAMESLQRELKQQTERRSTNLEGLGAATLAGGWIRVDERMPEPGNSVLLDIGTHTPIRAMWAAKHTIEAGDECSDDWGDYDEASDTYYCPEGWYEWNRHEETHWAVSDKAIAWMPLPATLSKQGGAA